MEARDAGLHGLKVLQDAATQVNALAWADRLDTLWKIFAGLERVKTYDELLKVLCIERKYTYHLID